MRLGGVHRRTLQQIMSVAEQKTQSSADIMAAAWAHFNAQKFESAERLARTVLNDNPGNADAPGLLGVMAYTAGKYEDAIAWMERAAQANPAMPGFQSNLCEIYRCCGKLDDAIAAGLKALELAPKHLQALSNLGIAYFEKGEMDRAEALYRSAIAADPKFAEAHNNLANALKSQGKLDEAILEYKTAIEIRPSYPEALNNLGATLREIGELEDSERAHRLAIGAKPSYVEAYNNLAMTLWERKQTEEALGVLARSMAVAPQKPDAIVIMATYMLELGRTKGALYACRRALRCKPDLPVALNMMGKIYRDLDDLPASVEYCRKAVALKPNSLDMLNNLGISLMESGDLEGAQEIFGRALELEPESLTTYINLASARKFKPGDPAIAFFERAIKKPDLNEEQRISAHYTLGKAYDDTGQYEKAFDQFVAGSSLKRAKVNYDETQALKLFDRIRQVFSPSLIAEKSGFGDPDFRPVFIVGMPRSGSTLVEQILASHGQVYGAGEVKHFHQSVTELDKLFGSSVRFPELMHIFDETQIRMVAKYYRENMPKLPQGKLVVTDKMLTNYYYVGLMSLVFPNARIIHCKRNPVDTCISGFSKQFREEMAYTYDLRETARFYKKYLELMEHWKAILPKGFLLEVTYERVVEDLEGEARRIFSHCGLDWDPACLEFYKTERAVRTASVAQVRQPLYNSAVARWKNYGDRIKPLLEELGPLAG